MKKYVILISISVSIILAGFMYYRVNNAVAKEYYEEEFSLQDYVSTETIQFKINSFKVDIDDEENIILTTNCNIKNLSDNTLDLNKVTQDNIASIDGITNDYSEIINHEEEAFNVASGEEANCEVVYIFYVNDLKEIKNNSDIRLDLARNMYCSEVKDYFYNGKLYSKFIVLGKWGNDDV